MNQEIIKSYNFFINSKFRNTGVPSNFILELNQSFTLNNVIPSQFIGYVDRAQIPYSFNSQSARIKNIYCNYSVNRNGTIYNGNFSIPEASYSISDLATVFVQYLRDSVDDVSGGAYIPSIEIVYSENTNHLRFSLSGTNNTITFFDTSLTQGLNRCLGFSEQWEMNSNLEYIESNIDCDVSPSRCLYIACSNLSQTQSFEAITTSFGLTNILTMIPMTHSPHLFIQHNPGNIIKSTFNDRVINRLQFKLLDDFGEVSDFDLNYNIHFVLQEVKINETIEFTAGITPGITQFVDTFTEEERMKSKEILERVKIEQEQELLNLRKKEVRRLEKLKNRLEKNKKEKKKKS